ncbi:MAG: right-handed parallel beta-helix repeat-containing protein, partial [Candidatus Obscuribacterales bacterium]|nr:right-handed parallel beta-helix repeat-containing protein [Candidatus Obscuribacterales bacterium]
DSQSADSGAAEFKYRPEDREDRLNKLTRKRADGVETVRKEFSGRSDNLLWEQSMAKGDSRGVERQYENGMGPHGLTRKWYWRNSGIEAFGKHYAPGKHPDAMVEHSFKKTGLLEEETKKYEGRPDGLVLDERRQDRDEETSKQQFEPGKGKNGLLSQTIVNGGKSSESRTYEPGRNGDKMAFQTVSLDGNSTSTETTFTQRADNLVRQMLVEGEGKTDLTKTFAEGSKERTITQADKSKISLKTSAEGSTQSPQIDKLVASSLGSDKQAADSANTLLSSLSGDPEIRDAIVGSILKVSDSGQSPPTNTDRTVMMIASTTGYAGLEKAGLKVDEKAGTATTKDGSKYSLAKDASGRLLVKSATDADGKRSIEFEYGENGELKGSLEKIGSPDVTKKFENLELPPFQKGWGPYQALEELQAQGKINMNPDQMKQEAVRIRDREFAKTGLNYFKVGDKPMMYAADEPAAKGAESNQLTIHRDASGNVDRMQRADGTALKIDYENGQPGRVSDGIGPDLISKDGGKTWQFDKVPESTASGTVSPTLEGFRFAGEMKLDTTNGTISFANENKSRLSISRDGTRTYTDVDGKDAVLFTTAQPERTQPDGSVSEPSGIRRGDSTPYTRGAGKPGRDGTIAQSYINQGDLHPEMLAVRNPQQVGSGGMKLRGTPTISAEQIDKVLRDNRSPAAKERIREAATGKELTFGQHLYKLGTEYGIDPAITLAFFKAESSFGKKGVANRTHSLGNIKSGRGYREYGSFAEGARDWFKLMQDGKHYFRKGRDTVGKIIPKYAPASDGNDETGYITNVERDVRKWSKESAHGTPVSRARTEVEPERRDTAPEKREVSRPDDSGRPLVEVKQGESIQAAIDKAAEGSIIHVQPGVYRERLSINKDNITLRGDGKAVIDLSGQNISGAALRISDRRNVTVDGFEIRNVKGGETPTGIRIDGASRDITLSNNNIHHVESGANAHGIGVFGTNAIAMRNISITGNSIHHLKLGQSESLVVNGNVDGFKITNNKIYDNDNIGIDIIGYEGVGKAGVDRARNGLVSGNEIYNIDSGKNPSYKTDRSAGGIYVDGGSDVVIEDNLIKNANYGIELAAEHSGRNAQRIQVRRNRIEGSHQAGISLGGGEPRNGGVSDSIIENNDLRNNARPIWRQNNIGSDVILRNNEAAIERPAENRVDAVQAKVVRQVSDRSTFYRHQDDGVSCSAFSMAMLASDHLFGRPVEYGKEAHSFKKLAGVTSHGYRGSLETMAGQLRSVGLESKAYQYGRFGQQGMADLNRELDQGHSAVARVINPHTGNRHYIYVAGRNADGNYILGDPDRANRSHFSPVSPKALMKMMSGRDGFVAGWASPEKASKAPGSVAYRIAQAGSR